MIKPYLYAGLAMIFIGFQYFSYNAGRQSVLQKLSDDRIEVLKDGKKIDADVLSADDDSLTCLLINCKTN